jgi:uncharacterized protein (DUF2235 family)
MELRVMKWAKTAMSAASGRLLRALCRVFGTAGLLVLGGCSSFASLPSVPTAAPIAPRHVAIFLDGTHNGVVSDTHIKRLHSLTVLQKRDDIAALYVEGVGVGSDLLGMTMGYGIKRRVLVAYEFLLRHAKPTDQIHIFGFSRGAYEARILTSLLYHAGLPQARGHDPGALARAVYDAVKYVPTPDRPDADRLPTVRSTLTQKYTFDQALSSVEVRTLGLWDTVEALGFPDWPSRIVEKLGGPAPEVVVDEPNQRYGDQLCNVRHAYHALSIDDNREWIFTPLLLGRKHLTEFCAKNKAVAAEGRVLDLPTRIAEVWFAGAHSDVGGGYADSGLGGLSLNWMIQQIEPTGLLPKGAAVNEDARGPSHDPEAGWFGPIYHSINRNLGGYALDTNRLWDRAALCMHPSVFERRRAIKPASFEFSLFPLVAPGVVRVVALDAPARPRRWREAMPGEQGAESIELQQWPQCTVLSRNGSGVNQ